MGFEGLLCPTKPFILLQNRCGFQVSTNPLTSFFVKKRYGIRCCPDNKPTCFFVLQINNLFGIFYLITQFVYKRKMIVRSNQ